MHTFCSPFPRIFLFHSHPLYNLPSRRPLARHILLLRQNKHFYISRTAHLKVPFHKTLPESEKCFLEAAWHLLRAVPSEPLRISRRVARTHMNHTQTLYANTYPPHSTPCCVPHPHVQTFKFDSLCLSRPRRKKFHTSHSLVTANTTCQTFMEPSLSPRGIPCLPPSIFRYPRQQPVTTPSPPRPAPFCKNTRMPYPMPVGLSSIPSSNLSLVCLYPPFSSVFTHTTFPKTNQIESLKKQNKQQTTQPFST